MILTLIFLAILWIGITLFVRINFGEWSDGNVMFGIIGTISIIAFSLGVLERSTNENSVDYVQKTENIISIQDNLETSGSFFLGCGNIGEQSYYYYYTIDEKGFSQLQKINTHYAKIKQSNEEKPRIEFINAEFTSGGFFLHWHRKGYRKKIWAGQRKWCKAIIYVPENSIVNNFNLDAQ